MSRHPRTVASMLVAMAALLVGTMHPAEAAFMVKLDAGGAATKAVSDGQNGLDLSSAPGVILFTGTVGNFMVNIQVASSNALNDPSHPMLTLNSSNFMSTGAGTLTISASDTAFNSSLAPLTFATAINGTLVSDTIAATAYYGDVDLNNQHLIGNVAPVGPGNSVGGTDVQSGFSPPTALFSLILNATITTTAPSQSVTFDANLSTVTVPEPSASLCLGIALFGLAGYGWWGRKKNNDPTQG